LKKDNLVSIMESANLGCCNMTVKYLVLIFNFCFFLCGIALIVLGGVVQGFFADYVEFFEGKYETPGVAIIILGSIILVISFFGCCGAKMENSCMLTMFAGLLGLIVVFEVGACIAVAVLRSEMEEKVQERMVSSLERYGPEDSLITQTWDKLQTEYHCCGVHNYTEWRNATVKEIPVSCCREKNCTPSASTVYTEGCYDSLKNSALNNLAAITVGAVILAILQVVGIWMACGLSRGVRDRYEVL